jgi:Holliday junction DNA helicase RuvA
MIATLSGTISEKLTNSIVLDVKGVGYGLLVTNDAFSRLGLNEEVKLYVYEHIRENVHDLYGFTDLESKDLFEQLVNVNGVGPKVAINILGIGTLNGVKQAIASGDVKLIQSAPGVGKRVAERVVIELKDKVGLLSSLDEQSLLTGEDIARQDEAVEALVALGYTVGDALGSLKSVDKSLSTSERVKLALKEK